MADKLKPLEGSQVYRSGAMIKKLFCTVCVAASIALATQSSAFAHPHVFVDANLEVVRDKDGKAREIRHVWRFDEIFSSSLLLDFDDNGNGKLDQPELDEIAKITKSSIGEYNFYTEIRNGETVIDFYEPEPYIVDLDDNGQLTIILALEVDKPPTMGASGFRVAVSDPTYYVAVDIADEGAVFVTGNDKGCSYEIQRPDFDALYEEDAQRLSELFAAGPNDEVEASEDYLTWIEFKC